MGYLDGKSVLVTGGTGSFGRAFVHSLLGETGARRIIIFSRDELKQYEMQQLYPGEERLRFFLGDVRDPGRLDRAFDGVDVIVHAAALKQILAAEYNPIEAIRTNIVGAENVINAAIDRGVERIIALSTDKSSSPINLYGATKLVSDKLFVAANAYAGSQPTRMSVVRYGNVMGSRGSVIPYFRKLAPTGRIPVTDPRMTRFWITLPQSVRFVHRCLQDMQGGEIYVPKLPSMNIVELVKAIAPEAEIDVVGIRPGEKLHEELISECAARSTRDLGDFYIIEPEMSWWPERAERGKELPEGYSYSSDTNSWWLDANALREIIRDL